MTALLFIIFFFFLIMGVPVAFSLGLSATLMSVFLHGSSSLIGIPTIIYDSLSSFTLVAIPLFILMANILIESGISRDLYDMLYDWFGHLPGGIAITTVLFCAGFSAISGSSVATAATVGMLSLPEMIDKGYDRKFSFGVVAAGGTIGILIPPSLFMILYGSMTDESVGKLFIAGVIPGLLMSGLFLIYTVIYCKIKNYQAGEKAPLHRRMASMKKAIWSLLLPVIVIGGIYGGIFTPTEAAAMAVIYSLFIAFVIKKIPLKSIEPIFLSTVKTTGMIFFIMMGAILFGHVITQLQVPQLLINFLGEADISAIGFIILVCVIFVFLGDFLEVVSITLITLPLIYPILLTLQIDPIWFAVIMCITMEFAMITPPVGLNLFIIQGIIPDSNQIEIFKGTFPFMLLMMLTLALIIIFPPIATWLVTSVN